MTVPVRVKICGLTREEDVALALALGADALGFNFAPTSPRCLTLPAARRLLAGLPPFAVAVGVHVNRPLGELVGELAALPRLQAIQLHGTGDEAGIPADLTFIRAFQVRDRASLDQIERYLDRCRHHGRLPSALLLDGYATGQHGGTGQRAPWHLLADFRPGLPVILAGGLTPDNVAEAITLVRPYAVDVASGVESAPGIKDAHKLERFLEAVVRASASLTWPPSSSPH